jgi:hypothetical protein
VEDAVSERLASSRALLLAARLHHAVGWPGVIGIALLIAALVPAGLAASQGDTDDGVTAAAPALVHSARPARSSATLLSPPAEIPLLLTQIEQAAVQQGLGWPQADYRQVPANGDAPARLEVHCTLKGAYPDVRRFIAAVLRDVPAATLKEFALNRPNSDTPTIEAHLAFAVFLQGTPPLVAAGGTP